MMTLIKARLYGILLLPVSRYVTDFPVTDIYQIIGYNTLSNSVLYGARLHTIKY